MRFSNEGEALTVSLKLLQKPSSQATTALTQELIKHFLFVRNQIPGLFSDLEQQVRTAAQVPDTWPRPEGSQHRPVQPDADAQHSPACNASTCLGGALRRAEHQLQSVITGCICIAFSTK